MTYRKFSLVEPPFPNLFIVFRNLWTLVHFSRTPSFVFSSLWTLCTKIPARGIPLNIPFFIKCFWTRVHTLSAAKPFVFNLLWNLEYSGGRCMVGHLGPLSFLKISSGGLRLTNW